MYGNYSGDNMNVKMASRMAKKEGIEVKVVVANDDVASALRIKGINDGELQARF